MGDITKIYHDNGYTLIGKGVGNSIFKDIRSANERIYIISPFVSADLAKTLVSKSSQGVDVILVTTATTKNRMLKKKHSRKVLTKSSFSFDGYAFGLKLILLLVLIFMAVVNREFSLKFWINVAEYLSGYGYDSYQVANALKIFFTILLFLSGLYLFSNLLFKKHFVFPVLTRGNHNLHSKIYIIDSSCYWGSANFTYSGFYRNFENITKSTSQPILNKFNLVVRKLMS
jgi:phosphatidylserine/phosphatidylglycerophosphate/cardiolipin synthase-like enzyme